MKLNSRHTRPDESQTRASHLKPTELMRDARVRVPSSSRSQSSRDASPGPDDVHVSVCCSGPSGTEGGDGKQNSSVRPFLFVNTSLIVLKSCVV